MFLKRCIFGDRFHRKRVDGRPNRKKKISVFKRSNGYVGDMAFIDRGFGRFHKGNTWIRFQSERTQPSCTDNFVMEDEDLLWKDKGNLRSKRFRAA